MTASPGEPEFRPERPPRRLAALKRHPLRTATALSAAGALLATTGLCVDAWLHALNPALLAQEGLVSANPGHLLLGGGLALLVIGTLTLLLWVHGSRRSFGLGGMLVMTSLFAAATLLLGIGTLGGSHSHSVKAGSVPD